MSRSSHWRPVVAEREFRLDGVPPPFGHPLPRNSRVCAVLRWLALARPQQHRANVSGLERLNHGVNAAMHLLRFVFGAVSHCPILFSCQWHPVTAFLPEKFIDEPKRLLDRCPSVANRYASPLFSLPSQPCCNTNAFLGAFGPLSVPMAAVSWLHLQDPGSPWFCWVCLLLFGSHTAAEKY
eukprot:EG_transcript_33902